MFSCRQRLSLWLSCCVILPGSQSFCFHSPSFVNPATVIRLRQTSNMGTSNRLSQTSECLEKTKSTPEVTTSILEFSNEVFDEYVDIMTEVMESQRVLKKDKKEDMAAVMDYLTSKSVISLISKSSGSEDEGKPEQELPLQEQAILFRDYYNFTQKEYDFAQKALVYMGDICAKRRLTVPVVVAWKKLREAGIMPKENCISTYMYILSTESDNHSTWSDTLAEVADFHAQFFKPNEKTTYLRIKNLVKKKHLKEAEEILSTLPDKGSGAEWKRLRTFLPILEFYCNTEDASSMLRLFRGMRKSPGVFFDENTYAMFVGSLAKSGRFCKDGLPIKGYQNAGFMTSHGPSLFDEIASEMADDLLELTCDAVKRIQDDFLKGFGISSSASTDAVGIVQAFEQFDGITIGRVEVDGSTGLCPATGSKLRLFALSEDQRQHVLKTLQEMARLSFLEFRKKGKKTTNGADEDENYGLEQLATFSKWLDERKGDPFTAVVDGANVAYYGFPELHYAQVKLTVDKLKEMGENPLVVIPKKYTQRTFRVSHGGKMQRLADRDIEFLERMETEDNIYIVPPRCLDDYYWMLASVSNQTNARQNCDLQVPAEDMAGRFPGLRPMLITNDQMRDHKLDLLEPREFRRWRSCHIVNYDVTPHIEDEWEAGRSIEFQPADFFSREIQGNEHASRPGDVWHFPVTDWEEPFRFCIWIDR